MTTSHSRALLASLLAAALSACSSGSSSTCATDADCASGDTCSDGQCLAPGQCESGVASCSDSSECTSNQVCTSGCCAPVAGCASSADCPSVTKPYCNPSTHACGPCTSNAECTTGQICAIASGACEPSCMSDTNCPASTPHCVTSGGYCAQCTESSQCPTSTPNCENNLCVGCTSTSCAAPAPVCNPSTRTCVKCLDSQNGANGKNSACSGSTPACENEACVACNPAANAADGGTNGACAGATPTCGPASTCVACTQSSQCTGGQICSAGNACEPLVLTGFTSSATTVGAGGMVTLTATLNGAVISPATIAIDIAADGGIAGALSSPSIVISSGSSGTATYTAPASGGVAVIEATFGTTTLSTAINVTAVPSALASIDLASASAVAPGSAVLATVSLTAATGADTAVAVSVDDGATINGSATASITVPAGMTTSPQFTIQLACNTAQTTATATLAGITRTAAIALDTSSPAVASLTASPTSVTMGQATTLTVTLSKPAGCAGTRVSLASAVAFASTSKFNGYIPSAIVVPAGQTSASIGAVGECYGGAADTVTVIADVPGTAPVTISGPDGGFLPIQLTPSSGLPSGSVVLCPIAPINADRPTTYPLGDGGVAPLPVLLTVGFADYKPPAATYAISLAATFADGGTCGTFSQDGGTLSSLSMSAPTKEEISFIPGAGASGPCTLSAQGIGTPTDGGAAVIYDAGIVSTFNLIDYNWAEQQVPTDLTLTKAEIDEDSSTVGTKNGLPDGGAILGDATEYVELYNPTSSSIDLGAYTLVFVGSPYDQNNGSATAKSEYWSYALSGTLQPGHYAIAQDANTFAAAPTAQTDQLLTWPDAGSAAFVAAQPDAGTSGPLREGNIWNTPGGIFLVKNAATADAQIIDGLTFGAPMQQATSESITGTAGGIFSWPPAPESSLDNWILDNSFVKGSLVRIGHTGSPALDWADSTTVQPGAANTIITGP